MVRVAQQSEYTSCHWNVQLNTVKTVCLYHVTFTTIKHIFKNKKAIKNENRKWCDPLPHPFLQSAQEPAILKQENSNWAQSISQLMCFGNKAYRERLGAHLYSEGDPRKHYEGWGSERMKGGKYIKSVFMGQLPVWATGAHPCWASCERWYRRYHKMVPL